MEQNIYHVVLSEYSFKISTAVWMWNMTAVFQLELAVFICQSSGGGGGAT
jgi:hypothetical protein